VQDTTCRYCEYIPVYPAYGYGYVFVHPNMRASVVCYYDKDKNFIKGDAFATSTNNIKLETPRMPNEAFFVRASATKAGAGGNTSFIIERYK
jgi:hypothetical protein